MSAFLPEIATNAEIDRLIGEIPSLVRDVSRHALARPVGVRLHPGLWLTAHPEAGAQPGRRAWPVRLHAESPAILSDQVRLRLHPCPDQGRSTLHLDPVDLAARGAPPRPWCGGGRRP